MSKKYESIVKGKIEAKEVQMGQGVVIEEGVLISGKGGPADLVVIEDFAYIGENTKILAPEFKLGEYSKLHAGSFGHGAKPLQIGRCCWIGGLSILDSLGGLDIDDNVGIGAQSQIWTHIQFGDVVEGSRFKQQKYMHIEKDVWFVGHCIVSPVAVKEKSMALVGSVVTRDMEANHIYAGSPAKDITEKVGTQFEERSVAQKREKLDEIVGEFYLKNPKFDGQINIVESDKDFISGKLNIDIANRTYEKTLSEVEVEFLKQNVPLVKFAPLNASRLIDPQKAV